MNKKPAADDTPEVLDVSELVESHTPTDFEADIPTTIDLRHVCPGCGRDSWRIDDSVQPPGSHAEAWKRGCCYGNTIFFWCEGPIDRRGIGQLTIIGSMEVHFFPDRRIESRPVTIDRRKDRP